MAIRSTDFTFDIMSCLHEDQGLCSDDKHLAKVVKSPANNADLIAFSLIHQDVLFGVDFTNQDIVMLVGRALDKCKDKPLNLLDMHTVLQKLVDKIDSKSDVSDMAQSRLGPHLMRHRKFKGIFLDNEMGL